MTEKATGGAVLTACQRSALESLAWATHSFGSFLTGRRTRRKTVLALVKRGLAESVGYAEQCDGDGFIIDDRVEREGFRITEAGMDAIPENYNVKRIREQA